MKLIVGLGNPGDQYHQSRHNVGYAVLDILRHRWSVDLKRRKFHGRFGAGTALGEQIVLLKPETFMNRSGQSVAEAALFYKVPCDELLIVVDDMDLELGRLRLRRGGSAGGHNGLKDIIARLGTDDFSRLRVGIGHGGQGRAVKHVLGAFSKEEQPIIESACEQASKAVETWLVSGIETAMNQYNKKEPEEKK